MKPSPCGSRRVSAATLSVLVSLAAFSVVLGWATPVRAQQKSPAPSDVALVDVRLSDAPDAPRKTLILRAGRIAAIQDASVEAPQDVRVIAGRGHVVTPAFVDAFTHAGTKTPTPVVDRDLPPRLDANVQIDMRDANRKGIQPSFQAASVFALEKDVAKSYRAAGFGALASSPHGQLLSGASALATTREAAPRDAFLAPSVFDVMGFDASGSGYPTTLMGSLAQLRQFLLDARRHHEIVARRAAGRQGARPPFDPDFDAARGALEGQRRVLCEVESANDLDRALALADEFGFKVAIAGGREAWRRAAVLKQREIPVFLTLEWGDEPDDPNEKKKSEGKKPGAAKPDGTKSADATAEPKTAARDTTDAPSAGVDTRPTHTPGAKPEVDATGADAKPAEKASEKAQDKKKDAWIYEEPKALRVEKRRVWEEKRSATRALADAGVPFAFGSGKNGPKELVDRVRKLVEAGLPLDVAWKGLTSGAAELLGVGRTLGRVEVGYDATLAVWTKDPLLSKDAKLAWLFVDGHVHEFEIEDDALTGKPDEGVDATGSWTITYDDPQAKPAAGELKMDKDGKVLGTLRFKSPADDSETTGEFEGQVAGRKIRLEGRVKMTQFEADVVIEGELDGDTWKGEARWKFPNRERTRPFTATRGPKGGAR